MILVDSSVLIQVLGGRGDRPKAKLFERVIAQDIPFAICPFVYQEVLQGVADDLTYRRVRSYLETQECLWPPAGLAGFEQSARLYRTLGRQGVTVRSMIDALIACTAIYHHAPLLHDDRDFDVMAEHVPELRILPVTALDGFLEG